MEPTPQYRVDALVWALDHYLEPLGITYDRLIAVRKDGKGGRWLSGVRQSWAYLVYTDHGISQAKIGRVLNRHHTTIMAAVRKCTRRFRDPEMDRLIGVLRASAIAHDSTCLVECRATHRFHALREYLRPSVAGGPVTFAEMLQEISPRNHDILVRIAEGESHATIARALAMGIPGVRHVVDMLIIRSGVPGHTRYELMAWYWKGRIAELTTVQPRHGIRKINQEGNRDAKPNSDAA